ncbi:hypothetical protein JCM10213_000618 [Rhodosporidiobolus nylandii]
MPDAPAPAPGPGTVHPPPPPATPGVVSPSRLAAVRNSRAYRFGRGFWHNKGLLAAGVGGIYVWALYDVSAAEWENEKRKAAERDTIHDNTYLYWKIYDGGIVEAKSAGSSLNYLLSSSQGGSPDEPPRVMTLFDVIRTIKFIEADDRIRGIIADFSSTSVPTVPSYILGLAQLEEIQDALLELRRVKQEKFGREGPDGWRTVAWTDSFWSQGQYLLASAFDEIYMQPTGEVPLVGMGSTTPFYGRLAKWLGIDIHAEARSEYKAFVQPYIDEQLTPPQRENHLALLNDLNTNLMTYLSRNRFSHLGGRRGLEHVQSLSKVGPFTAARAQKEGLVDGLCYRQDVIDSVLLEGQQSLEEAATAPAALEGSADPAAAAAQALEQAKGGVVLPPLPMRPLAPPKENPEQQQSERRLMGFYHFHKILETAASKFLKDTIEVGVVYLLGGIGDPGEFGTAAVVRGLKEAAEDDTIGAVVLRVDSGGGAVLDSDTIWGAVRDLKAKGKVVVASFGNSAASGGYWVSTHTDAILAAPSTVTGSIGVASLRPTFLQRFFDRFHLTLESLHTGSRTLDVTHQLTPEELERHKDGVDAMYADFLRRVCEGRGIGEDVVENVAGGRVMTGLKAFELVAPEALIRQIKGLDEPALETPAPVEGGEATEGASEDALPSVASEQSAPQATDNDSAVAVLEEGQETSPFAVPSVPSSDLPTSSAPSPPSPSSAAVSDTSEPSEALASPATAKPASGAVNGAAGTYDYEPGPYGRGLVDGLGGLRDAAIYACQMFIANGIAGYKLTNPDVSDNDAIKTLLPEAKFVEAEGGELAMQVDVKLKRFPIHKSFWQQLREASRRGDSLGDSASLSLAPVFSVLKAHLARSFLSAIAESLAYSSEVGGLDGRTSSGAQGTATPGLQNAQGWARSGGGARAEWSGLGRGL